MVDEPEIHVARSESDDFELFRRVGHSVELPAPDRSVLEFLFVACKFVDTLVTFRTICKPSNPEDVEVVVIVRRIVSADGDSRRLRRLGVAGSTKSRTKLRGVMVVVPAFIVGVVESLSTMLALLGRVVAPLSIRSHSDVFRVFPSLLQKSCKRHRERTYSTKGSTPSSTSTNMRFWNSSGIAIVSLTIW